MPPSYPAPARPAGTAAPHLLAQVQCSGAAILAALLLRRLDRLACDAAMAPVDRALCSVHGALTAVSLNAGLALVAALTLTALAARLLLCLARKAPVYIVDFTVHKPDARWVQGMQLASLCGPAAGSCLGTCLLPLASATLRAASGGRRAHAESLRWQQSPTASAKRPRLPPAPRPLSGPSHLPPITQ
jgi:hypothetical protein